FDLQIPSKNLGSLNENFACYFIFLIFSRDYWNYNKTTSSAIPSNMLRIITNIIVSKNFNLITNF
ncbi:hypothetical protein, partial [Salmonella sp. s55044]|uniref:hypothetical protein n=1 Tax=Salmonella sp. s55044 TaxID=3159677 RepID=UPI003980E18C